MFYNVAATIPPHLAVLLVILVIPCLIMSLVLIKFFKLWLQAKLANAPVPYVEIIGMFLRKTDAKEIVINKIVARQAGLDLSTRQLECHHLAGGRVTSVVRALIVADRNDINMSFEEAASIDLSGRSE